jgi:hypothetical protein
MIAVFPAIDAAVVPGSGRVCGDSAVIVGLLLDAVLRV